MKVKPAKRKHQKKQKKSSSILVLENEENNNYHVKKNNDNNIENENIQFDEKSYKDKLKEIYELIKYKKYDKKPNDIYLNAVSNKLVYK